MAYIPSYLGGINETLLDRRFTLETIEAHPEGDRIFVRVQFRYTRLVETGSVHKNGWLLLDPAHYWTIRAGECTTTLNDSESGPRLVSRARVNLAYTLTDDGFPLIAKQSLVSEFPETGRQFLMEETYEFWEQPQPNEAEFRLSYYGFPEPEELRWSRPTPWWLYILLAGLALVMLSFAIYAWRRHRRQQLALP
jgi:hypothetical protein